MTTVANRKFAEMKQIEFQQTASSSVNTMLNQPLLEKASTWICEVTDFECTLGEEPAFPENEWMFTIVKRPLLSTDANATYNTTNLEVHFDVESFVDYVENLYLGSAEPIDDYGIWGYHYITNVTLNDTDFDESDDYYTVYVVPRWSNRVGPEGGVALPPPRFEDILDFNSNSVPFIIVFGEDPYNETHIHTGKYYSDLDFIDDLANKVRIYDRKLHAAYINATDPNRDDPAYVPMTWENTSPDVGVQYISLYVDSGGNIMFHMTPVFLEEYTVITSPLFGHLTGMSPLLGFHLGIDNISVLSQLLTPHPTRSLLWWDEIGIDVPVIVDFLK